MGTPGFKKEWLGVSALLLVFITAISPAFPGPEFDTACWRNWALHIHESGLRNTYDRGDNNYLPFYQYILWIYAKLNGDSESIFRNIAYLRVFTLLFEYWALWLVYKWLDRKPDFGYLLICSLLNIAYSYNLVIWGQVDGIMAALVFAAFYFLWNRRLVLSAIVIVLALNMKLQAIIYMPLWGLIAIGELHRGRNWKRLLVVLPTMLATQLLLLFPFMLTPEGMSRLGRMIMNQSGWYPVLSMNAYNMWYWLLADAGSKSTDTAMILGVTARQFGFLSFCFASFFALLPVLRYTTAVVFGARRYDLPKETIWLSAILLSLAFFFFNTQMHERYVHGAFIFLTAYAFQRRQFGLYALFSVAYLLNLDDVLQGLKLANYETLIFDPRFVSVLFAGCIVWAFVLLYRQAPDRARGYRRGGEDITRRTVQRPGDSSPGVENGIVV